MSNLGKAALNLRPLLHHKNKGITAKHQDERIAGSTYRIYSCHFAGSTHFYFIWGVWVVVGINGHTQKCVLILPAERVFLSFGVKASLGDDSSSRRFTFGGRKCLVEPPA